METVEQRVVVDLTPSEIEKLQKAINGYGKLKYTADLAQVHFQTIKNVVRIGRGESRVIKKLRNTVLAA